MHGRRLHPHFIQSQLSYLYIAAAVQGDVCEVAYGEVDVPCVVGKGARPVIDDGELSLSHDAAACAVDVCTANADEFRAAIEEFRGNVGCAGKELAFTVGDVGDAIDHGNDSGDLPILPNGFVVCANGILPQPE